MNRSFYFSEVQFINFFHYGLWLYILFKKTLSTPRLNHLLQKSLYCHLEALFYLLYLWSICNGLFIWYKISIRVPFVFFLCGYPARFTKKITLFHCIAAIHCTKSKWLYVCESEDGLPDSLCSTTCSVCLLLDQFHAVFSTRAFCYIY